MKEIFSTLIKKPVTVGLKGPEKMEFDFTVQGILGNIVVGTDEAEQKIHFVYMNHVGYIVTDNVLLIPEVEVDIQEEPVYKNVLQTVLKQESNNNQEENGGNQQGARRRKVVY